MSDNGDVEEMFLPDDLKALDDELSSIRYEERPSFVPELRAELARVHASRPARRAGMARYLAAAALAGLLLAGVSVPTARASLVRFLGSFGGDAVEAPVPAPTIAGPIVEPEVGTPPPPEPVEETSAFPAVVADLDPIVEEATVAPRWLDREGARTLLRDAYPERLQRAGVGGVVRLRLWVDQNGIGSLANVVRGSGIVELDRVAVRVAPMLRFAPAFRGGVPVSTWIEFPVVFEPEPTGALPLGARPAEDPMRLPDVPSADVWEFREPLAVRELPDWTEEDIASVSAVERALIDAIGDPIVRRSLGPIEAIVSGVAPEGRGPTEWRAAASVILEDAMRSESGNPAPLLALGRIRLRQGLRTDARMLFEEGLQIAIAARSDVSPSVVAELHVERGRLLREGWLASHGVGRVHARAFEDADCAQARSSGGVASGFASIDRLMAWNYLCPSQLSRVFEGGFEVSGESLADLSLMMGSFKAAIAAEPGHPGANLAYLVALADEERWEDVLAGGRRFARRSGGDPKALLLTGLALERLGRVEEASEHFTEALNRLPAPESELIRDISFLIDPGRVEAYRRLWGEERRAWEAAFWRGRDRTPSTAVSEREVQHLARSTYAWLRFGGTTSDPGEVWVRFGGPNRVHVVDAGAGQLTEFWDYGSGPDITFVRWVASQSLELTQEGRAYVDDLGKIFPPQ